MKHIVTSFFLGVFLARIAAVQVDPASRPADFDEAFSDGYRLRISIEETDEPVTRPAWAVKHPALRITYELFAPNSVDPVARSTSICLVDRESISFLGATRVKDFVYVVGKSGRTSELYQALRLGELDGKPRGLVSLFKDDPTGGEPIVQSAILSFDGDISLKIDLKSAWRLDTVIVNLAEAFGTR